MSADRDVLRGLADEIERRVSELEDMIGDQHLLHSARLGSFVRRKASLILAVLRASQSDGAAAMRQAAAGVVRYRGERARMALSGGCDGGATNRAIRDACANMASEIDALPLAQPNRLQETATGGETK